MPNTLRNKEDRNKFLLCICFFYFYYDIGFITSNGKIIRWDELRGTTSQESSVRIPLGSDDKEHQHQFTPFLNSEA